MSKTPGLDIIFGFVSGISACFAIGYLFAGVYDASLAAGVVALYFEYAGRYK